MDYVSISEEGIRVPLQLMGFILFGFRIYNLNSNIEQYNMQDTFDSGLVMGRCFCKNVIIKTLLKEGCYVQGENKVYYTALERIDSDKNAIYIYHSGSNYFILPYRAFLNAEEHANFYAFIQSKVNR